MKLSREMLKQTHDAVDVVPGNIYPAQGGRKTPGTSFWLVVAVNNLTAHCLGYNDAGEPVSTVSYFTSVMRSRPLLGRCDLSSVVLVSKGDNA